MHDNHETIASCLNEILYESDLRVVYGVFRLNMVLKNITHECLGALNSQDHFLKWQMSARDRNLICCLLISRET